MPDFDSNDPSARAAGADEAYCPHCFLLVCAGVSFPWPAGPARCPHCRLMIGAGRAHASSDGVAGARGAAAGVMVERARRIEGGEGRSTTDIALALLAVARARAVAPERLLMVDYQQHATRDPSLPQLHEVLAAYGSWKSARRESVRGISETAAAGNAAASSG